MLAISMKRLGVHEAVHEVRFDAAVECFSDFLALDCHNLNILGTI
jgi:hypothetical protein